MLNASHYSVIHTDSNIFHVPVFMIWYTLSIIILNHFPLCTLNNDATHECHSPMLARGAKGSRLLTACLVLYIVTPRLGQITVSTFSSNTQRSTDWKRGVLRLRWLFTTACAFSVYESLYWMLSADLWRHTNMEAAGVFGLGSVKVYSIISNKYSI